MAPYMLQAQQKWAITPVANAGGYPGSPYFKITIAGTDRALAATADAELIVVPRSPARPNNCGASISSPTARYRLMPKARAEREGAARALGGRQQHADAREVRSGERSPALAAEDAMTGRSACVAACARSAGDCRRSRLLAAGQQPARPRRASGGDIDASVSAGQTAGCRRIPAALAPARADQGARATHRERGAGGRRKGVLPEPAHRRPARRDRP